MKKRINIIALLAMVILHSYAGLSFTGDVDRLRKDMHRESMLAYTTSDGDEDDKSWNVPAEGGDTDRLRNRMHKESMGSYPISDEDEDDEEWNVDEESNKNDSDDEDSDDEESNKFDDNYFRGKKLNRDYFESEIFAEEFEQNMNNVRSFADQTIGFTTFIINIKEASYSAQDITVNPETLFNLAEIASSYQQTKIAKKLLNIAKHQLELLQSRLKDDLATAMGKMDRSAGKSRTEKNELAQDVQRISQEHGKTMNSLEEIDKHLEKTDRTEKFYNMMAQGNNSRS